MLSKALETVLKRLSPKRPIHVLRRVSNDEVRHVQLVQSVELRVERLTGEEASKLLKGLEAHVRFAPFERRKSDRKNPPHYQGRGVYYRENPEQGLFLRLEIRRYADGYDTIFLDSHRDLVFPPVERVKQDVVTTKNRRISDQLPSSPPTTPAQDPIQPQTDQTQPPPPSVATTQPPKAKVSPKREPVSFLD
jgi:hypothetical protein